MQVKDNPCFDKRALFYTAKAYTTQINKGEDYPKLNQVIFIGILDFNSFDGDNYLTRHLILNKETLKQELRDFEFNFIELKKFNKQEAELESIIDKWIYFIKNAGNLSLIPQSAEAIPELKQAYAQALMQTWSQKELDIYEYWQIHDATDKLVLAKENEKSLEQGMKLGIELGIEQGIEQGIKQGIELGIEQGIQETKMEVVRTMQAAGIAVDVIMLATGFTEDEIADIKT